jgi:hypothetical protein
VAVSRKNNAVSTGMDDDALRNMRARIRASKADADEARGEVGAAYKEVEDRGEHRGALKLAIKLSEMEPTKQSAFLSSFDRYLAVFGVGAQEELFAESETGHHDAPEPPLPLDPVVAILRSDEARLILARALEGRIYKLGASLRLVEMGVPAERADRWLEESGVKDHRDEGENKARGRSRRRAASGDTAAAAAE